MTPILQTLLVTIITFGGSLLGMWLRRRLPVHHVDAETRDIVRVSIGLVVTTTALILGLVVSTAKASFDAEDSAVKQSATDVLALDQVLRVYGSETLDIRRAIRRSVANRIALSWPESGAASPIAANEISEDSVSRIIAQILALTPTTDAQRWLQSQALQQSGNLQENLWLEIERHESAARSPFAIVLMCWLGLIFVSFGLFAPRHATGVATLIACSLSVSAAVFLILEMDRPYQGLIKVSPEPLVFALSIIDK